MRNVPSDHDFGLIDSLGLQVFTGMFGKGKNILISAA